MHGSGLFEPLDFIARLAALVPRPRGRLLRYHGLFAPNAHGSAGAAKHMAGIVPDNPLHSRHPWRSDVRERPTPAIDIGSCPSTRHLPCPARRRLHVRVRAPALAGCNDCGAPSVSMSAAARAVGRPFESSHTSPTRGSSPPSSSTLPLAMPHPTSPAHRPVPELLPIHPPRLANSHSSPKTALAYTIPVYANSGVRFQPVRLSALEPNDCTPPSSPSPPCPTPPSSGDSTR